MKKFSTNAFRSFKIFIGELTAVAAGIHVGIKEAIPNIESLNSDDRWNTAASKHNIIVSGLKSSSVIDSSIRLNIVSLYSGFDLFIADIRSQFHTLHERDWRQYDGDSPFDAIARNTPSSPQVHASSLGKQRVAVLNYYRLVRNAIAHPREEARCAVSKFWSESTELLNKARAEYAMQSVPNEFHSLTFHDIKFLARVALDVAKAIDMDFDPGDERLAKLIPMSILRQARGPERKHKALIGWLRCTYGVPIDRAERIIANLPTHKLNG